MKTWVWIALGFLAGGILGGLAVYEGDLTPSTPAPRGTPSARGSGEVVVRVENVGTHAINATMDVSRMGGASIWSGVLFVPAQGDRDHPLPEEPSGKFTARGRFTWAEPPRRGTGDFIIAYDADECGAQTLWVVFRIDSTNGISFPDGEIKECR